MIFSPKKFQPFGLKYLFKALVYKGLNPMEDKCDVIGNLFIPKTIKYCKGFVVWLIFIIPLTLIMQEFDA